MVTSKSVLCLGLIFMLILSSLIPNVKAWEKGTSRPFYNLSQGTLLLDLHLNISLSSFYMIADFEIFDLVDEIEKSEGKETNFYTWLNLKVRLIDGR